MLEGVIPLETFPLVEWHYGELADVPSFTVLKTQICVTRPQCVNNQRCPVFTCFTFAILCYVYIALSFSVTTIPFAVWIEET